MKHKQSDIYEFLIKRCKSWDRKAFWSRPNVIWICAIAIMGLVIVLVSYFTYCSQPWISNLCLNIATGLISGIVFYMLTNLKNVYSKRIQNDAIILADIISKTSELNFFLSPMSTTLLFYSPTLQPVSSRSQINILSIVQDISNELDNLSGHSKEKYNHEIKSISEHLNTYYKDEESSEEEKTRLLATQVYQVLSKADFFDDDAYKIAERQSSYEKNSIL